MFTCFTNLKFIHGHLQLPKQSPVDEQVSPHTDVVSILTLTHKRMHDKHFSYNCTEEHTLDFLQE